MLEIGSTFGPSAGEWSMRVTGTVVPEETGLFQLALAQAGRARLLVDDEVVLDGFANQPPPGGNDFFGQASQDLVTDVPFEKGVPAVFVVEYASRDTTLAGFRVGFRTPDADALLERAVAAAAAADVAVVCVGTSEETETEGRDRTAFALPGRQDELIRRVVEVNDRVVVVVNAASPVDMPWAGDVAAVLQCWFGGQEMAGGLTDVLVGTAEPGGRLPTTIPRRLEHSPSHANFPGENGELRYGEGLFMGYRGDEHNAIAPRFPFGHGLSYTTFALGEADGVRRRVPTGRDVHGDRPGDQHGATSRIRGRPVLRRSRIAAPGPTTARSSRPSPRSGSSRARRRRSSSCSMHARSPTGTRVRTTGRTCRRSCPTCSTSCRHRCHAVSGGGTWTPAVTTS